jgi:hypothetical protein
MKTGVLMNVGVGAASLQKRAPTMSSALCLQLAHVAECDAKAVMVNANDAANGDPDLSIETRQQLLEAGYQERERLLNIGAAWRREGGSVDGAKLSAAFNEVYAAALPGFEAACVQERLISRIAYALGEKAVLSAPGYAVGWGPSVGGDGYMAIAVTTSGYTVLNNSARLSTAVHAAAAFVGARGAGVHEAELALARWVEEAQGVETQRATPAGVVQSAKTTSATVGK